MIEQYMRDCTREFKIEMDWEKIGIKIRLSRVEDDQGNDDERECILTWPQKEIVDEEKVMGWKEDWGGDGSELMDYARKYCYVNKTRRVWLSHRLVDVGINKMVKFCHSFHR